MGDTNVYAIKAKDIAIQKKSSSGGAFIVLSDYVLGIGGAIACSVYSYETHSMNFYILENQDERDSAIGSKYMQSCPGTIYEECFLWIKSHPGKVLLFVGMGCQAAAFKMYAEQKGIKDSVLIVDIVCHGVPSPQMWLDYVDYIQKKYGGTLTSLTFKDKRNGWKRPTAAAVVGEKEVFLRDYIRVFNSGMALRPSCYSCPYTCIDRQTDLTIGDFWGIEKSHPEFMSQSGVSLVLTHTAMGRDVFECIKANFDYIETKVEECLQPQLEHPSKCAENRSKFWKEYKQRGINYVMHKYGDVSIIEKIQYKLKHLLK